MKEILVVRDLFKGFKKNKLQNEDVLKGVSFELYEGESIAIVGANGAGKTVLLNTIFKIIDKNSGDVYLDLGRETFEENLEEIGFQFQSQIFSQGIKLKKIIDEYKVLYKDRINESTLDEMLDIFELKDLLNKKTNVFSGGQKQRANLLFAMMTNPKLIVLDEFITGLDVNSVENIINYVFEHKKKNNSSLIIISHQPKEIEKLVDRIIILKDGKISGQTTPKDVLLEYPSMETFLKEVM